MLYTLDELKEQTDKWPEIGKKAESLVRMRLADLPVPDGAVVAASAFHAFARENGFAGDIDELRGTSVGNLHRMHELGKGIRSSILGGSVSGTLTEAVSDFTKRGKDFSYAVRSSGSKEDLESASFAGQYTTILNVKGENDLLKAIKECWASAYSDQVISYCTDYGIGFTGLEMSVILQEMVPAEKSGVLFSVNPMTGADKEMLIEAAFGLGEALVSGKVTPDMYCYNWYDEKETLREIAAKESAVKILDGVSGTVDVTCDQEEQLREVLDRVEVETLVRLGLSIQDDYGFPVDVEWAWYNNRFYILQSRPVTKLNFSGISGEWTTADFKDGGVSSSVCTPFMWSLYDFIWETTMPAYLKKIKLVDDPDEIVWGDMFFGRPYWNVFEIKKGLQKLPGFNERNFDRDLGIEITYDGDGATSKTTPKTVWRALNVFMALKKSFKQNMEYVHDFRERQGKKLRELENFDAETLSNEDFFNYYIAFIREEYFLSESSYFNLIYNNSNLQSLFKDTFKNDLKDVDLLTLMSGLRDLAHLRPNYRLWDISRKIRVDKSAKMFWTETGVEKLIDLWRSGSTAYYLDELSDFIDEFKYLSTRELDITVPRYGEDPSFVFAHCKDLILLADDCDPRTLNERQHRNYLKERNAFLDSLSFFKAGRLAKALDEVRRFLWWREELRDLSTQYYYYVRKLTLELGKRLTDLNVINETEDIFFPVHRHHCRLP